MYKQEVNTDKQMYMATLTHKTGDDYQALKNMEDLIKNKKNDINDDEKFLFFSILNPLISKYRDMFVELINKKPVIGKVDLKPLIEKQKRSVEEEIKKLCKSTIDLVENHLLKKALTDESKALYLTMKAEYFRYSFELKTGRDRQNFFEQCKKSFEEAQKFLGRLSPLSYAKLRYTLIYSLFQFEINGDLKSAIQTLEESIKQIDTYYSLNKPKLKNPVIDLKNSLNETLKLMKMLDKKSEEK